MLVSIIGQISVIVGTILFRPIIVILHELGHAIPSLIFTKGKVIINIGDTIDVGNNWTLEFSRIKFIFNYRKLFLGGGFVSSDVNAIKKWQYITIILGGPLFSFGVGLVSFYLSIFYDIHGAMKILFLFILCLSFFDFMAIFKYEVSVNSGYYTFSDGAQINLLVLKDIDPSLINCALNKYYSKNYISALRNMHDVIQNEFKERYFAYTYLCCLCHLKKYKEAINYFNKTNQDYSFTAMQISTFGVLLVRGKESKGNELIHMAQKLDPNDTNIILNSAFTLLIEGDFKKCISMFSYIISTNVNVSYALANRGLAKILDNNISEGITDINNALEINAIETYAHRNKGIYYSNIGDYKRALEHFRVAYKYDKDTYEVEENIDACLKKLLEN